MPLSRYEIRNEYSVADPELYRAAEKDDPESLLEAVAMAGLVGVLRQLGDLAQFAAQIFHDLHEEVMTTAARGHGLMVRVQQLEAEFPLIEKVLLSQSSHSSFFYDAGTDWHPSLHMDQNLITRGELPQFVMDSYEECRGPPRLFLLDKFDVGGAGACLKRYTDPSVFKVEASSHGKLTAECQREKKTRKVKKKASRWRYGETPEMSPASHAKFHQLLQEEQVQNGIIDPAHRVKLKRRLNGFSFDSKSMESYMRKFLKGATPEHEVIHEISSSSFPLKLSSNFTCDSGLEVHEISTVHSDKESTSRKKGPCSPPNVERVVSKPLLDKLNKDVNDVGTLALPGLSHNFEADSSMLYKVVEEKEIVVDGESKTEENVDGYQSDDIASEVDNYMDALTTMDSEMETDTELRMKNYHSFLNTERQGTDSNANEEQLQARSSDSQSIENSTASDDGIFSSKRGTSISYSYSPSTSAENMPLESDVSIEVFPSSGIGEVQIIDKSSDQHSVNQGFPLTQPPENILSTDASIEFVEIRSYRDESGDPTSSSLLLDSAPMLLHTDLGATIMEGMLVGQEHAEVSSKCNQIDAGFTNSKVNVALVENSLGRSNLSGKSGAKFYPMDELNYKDPNMFPVASIQFSHISEGGFKPQSSDNSLDDVPQTEYVENYNENLVDNNTSSLHSIISHAKEQLYGSAFPEVESCNPDVNTNAIISEEDDVPSNGEMAINLTPAEDGLATHNFTELQVSVIMDGVLDFEPDSCFEQKCHDSVYGTADSEEITEIVPNFDLVGSVSVTLKELPEFLVSASLAEVQECLDCIENERVESDTVTLSAAVVCANDDVNDDDYVDFSFVNPRELQEESVSRFGFVDQNKLEVNEAWLPENQDELGVGEQVNQQEVASLDFDSVQCNTHSYHSDLKFLNGVLDSLSMPAEEENNVNLDETMEPSSLEHSGQESQSKSAPHSNVENVKDASSSVLNQQAMSLPDLGSVENAGDASSIPTFAELRIPVKQKINLQADQFYMESPNDISPVENIEDASSLSSFAHSRIPVEQKINRDADQLDLESTQQISLVAHTEDASCLPTIARLRIPIEQKINFQAGQLDAEMIEAAETTSESFSRWEHGKSSNLLNHERQSDAPTEPCQEKDQSQCSVPNLLQVRIAEKAKDTLSSNLPVFGMLPGTIHVSLDQMPPLPPLPPIQWRIGKLQQDSPASEIDAIHDKMDPSQTILPCTADGKAQVGYSTMEVGTVQSSDPLLPLSAKDQNSQQFDEHVANHMVDSSYSEDDSLTIGRTKSVNPFLLLPAIHSDMLQRFNTVERGRIQPKTNQCSGVTALVDTNQPLWSAAEDGKPNVSQPTKLHQPQNPPIDAAAAFDRSKLMKVTERVPPEKLQVDEKDSILEQIRTKSFNLKPAVVNRPSIQGPKTNLKIAAILEKATAIRQALAGSDEDDDADSWSDS